MCAALSDGERDAVPSTNKMFAPLRDMGATVSAGAPSSAVDERISPEHGDIVVRKIRVGAFSTTNLDEQLRARRVDTLLAGISTSGVVLSTVRDAAHRDYRLSSSPPYAPISMLCTHSCSSVCFPAKPT